MDGQHGPLAGRNAVPHMTLWRASRGLSMKALAERAGVSISTVLHAEQGKRLTMVNLVKLARALGVSVDTLLNSRPEA